ncbi:MAG: lipopolysaccharide biosynthesis protein [Betaproteobacteria bacterium]
MTGLRKSVVHGALWAVALRWLMRLVGVANVAILARILGPSDFGLVAMATLVVGLVETWLAFGVDSALIQNADADRHDFDTAWTIRLLQGAVIALLVVAASPLAQAYFKEPRLGPLLWVLALGILISGAANIGVVMYRKELRFQTEFWILAISKLLSFAVSVAAAFWLRNYWALAIGIVGGYTIGCVVSYVAHPFRPRFSLSRWRKLWSFSQWVVVMNIIGYAETKADEVLVGGYTSAAQMGLYSVASDVGQMPSAELSAPLNRVLFPTFSRLQDEPGRLAAAYTNALATVAMVTVPAGIGLAMVAPEAVRVLLGPKWTAAVPLLAILALWGTLRSLSSSGGYVLMSIGLPKLVALTTFMTVLVFASGASLALWWGYGPLGIAIAKVVAACASLMITVTFVVRHTHVHVRTVLRGVIRPVFAACTMAAVLQWIPGTPFGALADLILKIAVGAAVYITAVLVLWYWAGRPDGPERLAMNILKRLFIRNAGAAAD